jgi:transposase
LRKEGICLQRQRSWCVSTDKEFAAKAADIVGLYLNPPEKALVISVDEKPSIQALERATGYVETDNGKLVRGFKSTYKRHGTLNLFAALRVATGHIQTNVTTLKRREEFLQFMDQVVAEAPADGQLHVILDSYCTHKKCHAWLAEHPNVHFHFTPTSASWLNQVEIWFGILSRKALRGASFKNVTELRQAIEDFIAAYNGASITSRGEKHDLSLILSRLSARPEFSCVCLQPLLLPEPCSASSTRGRPTIPFAAHLARESVVPPPSLFPSPLIQSRRFYPIHPLPLPP